MDMYGNLSHYGNYIKGDDGILYSNDSYNERLWKTSTCGYGYRGSSWDKWDRWYDDYKYSKGKKTESKIDNTEEDYDSWYNSEEYWKSKDVVPF